MKFKNEIGLRINPLYSEINNDKYNAASFNSRLGIHLNDLDNIVYSYRFKLIGFKFHKEIPNGNNYIRIKSLENDKVYKLTI